MAQPDLFNAKRYASLDEVLNALKNLKDDPLANAGTNVVISRGNSNAKLLLIGEAPGPQENIKGKPFVGPAGQLLDKILQAGDFAHAHPQALATPPPVPAHRSRASPPPPRSPPAH